MKMKLISLLVLAISALSGTYTAAADEIAVVANAQDVDIYARHKAVDNIVTERLPDGRYRARVPLAAIREQQGSMVLQDAYAQEALGLAIAPQIEVESANLFLRHVTGRGQSAAEPHLRVGLNGQFVAQLDAATDLTAAFDRIALDRQFFQPGFNMLSFGAVQRYTYECQNPQAAELWTEIDTARSEVDIIYKRREFTGTLADFDAFLSPGIGGVDNLVIATAAQELGAQHLGWGTIISQTVANRMKFRIPKIEHARIRAADEAIAPDSLAPRLAFDRDDLGEDFDLVLIGRFDELGDVISVDRSTIDEDEGYLALGPSPLDPTRFVIIVSGHTDEAVSRAVDAFALSSFPFNDDNETLITSLDAPVGVAIGERAPLRTGVAYTFADLGYQTQSFIGQQSANMNIDFVLPVDTFFAADDEIKLSLDFAYGAGLDERSVLNIMVNGAFRSAIPIRNPLGEAASGYEVSLPSRAFRGGANTISLQAELSKDQVGACSARNDRNLAILFEENSIIRIPQANRFVELPNLKLFSQSGFPYSGASNETFSVHVAERTDDTVAAAWTLLARLGQIHGDRFRGIEFKFDNEAGEEHTLLVGTRQSLGHVSAGSFNLNAGNSAKTQTPMRSSFSATAGQYVRASQSASLGRNGLLMSGENPLAKDTLLTVFTAQSNSELLAAVRNLVEPSHWSQLKGANAVWRQNPATFATEAASESFYIGDLDGRTRVTFINSQRPWRFIFMMGGLLLLAASILAWVARYLRARLNVEE